MAVLYGSFEPLGSTILCSIVPGTGVTTAIGVIGYDLGGMAFDYTTQTMYGVTHNGGPDSFALVTVNLTTGAGTLVGFNDGSSGPGDWGVSDLAVSSAGVLYGMGVSLAPDAGLYEINKATGLATLVGAVGPGYQGGGCDFVNGVLHAMFGKKLYSFSTVTGVATYITDLSEPATMIAASTNPSSQVLWALDSDFGTGGYDLSTVDVVTGAVVDVSNPQHNGRNSFALAWAPSSTQPVHQRIYGIPVEVFDDGTEQVRELIVGVVGAP